MFLVLCACFGGGGGGELGWGGGGGELAFKGPEQVGEVLFLVYK